MRRPREERLVHEVREESWRVRAERLGGRDLMEGMEI